jgi:hypothetical protein
MAILNNNSGAYMSGGGSWISGTLGATGFSGSIGVTGTTASWTTTTVTSGYLNIQPQKTKYNVLGTEIEVDGYTDPVVAMYISMVNIMGKQFYDEVKKQGVNFPKEIESFLEKALIAWNRNEKIDTIFDDKGSGI